MCTWAILSRHPKLRYHGISYSQILFFLRKDFLHSNSEFLFYVFKSITSVFCTFIANRKRILQPAEVPLCLTLTGLSILPLSILVLSWIVFVLSSPLSSFLLQVDILESSHTTCTRHFQTNSKWIEENTRISLFRPGRLCKLNGCLQVSEITCFPSIKIFFWKKKRVLWP